MVKNAMSYDLLFINAMSKNNDTVVECRVDSDDYFGEGEVWGIFDGCVEESFELCAYCLDH